MSLQFLACSILYVGGMAYHCYQNLSYNEILVFLCKEKDGSSFICEFFTQQRSYVGIHVCGSCCTFTQELSLAYEKHFYSCVLILFHQNLIQNSLACDQGRSLHAQCLDAYM